MKELNFENQSLQVDFITLTLPRSNFCQQSFADYFSKLKFNSRKIVRQNKKETLNKPILTNEENDFTVKFIFEFPETRSLEFTGKNGARFYFLIQNNAIDWKLFKDVQLTRFDLCVVQKIKLSKNTYLTFLHDCQQYIRPNLINKVDKTERGHILKVGARRSPQHYRIYYNKEENQLRFEYEIKYDLAKSYTDYLLDNALEFFESDLTQKYIRYSSTVIPLRSKYSSWLVSKLRYFRKMPPSSFVLKTDYIEQQHIKTKKDEKNLIQFIFFLAYIRKLTHETEYLGSTHYRCISFKVTDFLQFQNDSYSYYKLKELKNFLYDLQTNLIIQKFSDTYFQSLVSVPKVEIFKEKRSVMAKIWIVDELFSYQFPFSFPYFEINQLSKHEFSVLSFMLSTFTGNISINKHYNLNQFFENNSTFSCKDIKLIKGYFIKYINEFVNYNLIENEIFLIQDKSYCRIDQLTTQNISEGFIVYELLEYKISNS